MDITKFPKGLISVVAIVIGFIVIVLANPPKTLCDSQLEVFQQSQKSFLFSGQKKSVRQTARIQKYVELCRENAGPGGCLELLQGLRKMVADLDNVPRTCSEQIADIEEINYALQNGLQLMIQVAWGSKPPLSIGQRQGWFEVGDVGLFCRLKNIFIEIHGKERWEAIRNATLKTLPGSEALTQKTATYQLSLASVQCEGH